MVTRDRIKEYLHKYWSTSNAEIARLIINQESLDVKEDNLRRWVSKVRNAIREDVDVNEFEEEEEPKTEEEEILIETKKKDTYKVHNEQYIWRTKHGDIRLSIGQADEMFFKYSSFGEDLSALEVRQSYNLEPWEWHSIKNRLGLYKQSHVFSPETWKRTPDGQKEKMVADKMRELLDNSNKFVAKKYSQEFVKESKRYVESETKYRLFTDIFKSEYLERLPKAKPIEVKRVSIKNPSVNDLVVSVTDFHNGAITENLTLTLDFNSDILYKRLMDVADKINEYNSSRVHLHLLGDFIESFTGLNHLNSMKSMNSAITGCTAFWQTRDLLRDFLSKINNIASIRGVAGNHDRSSGNKKEDTRGEIGLSLLEGIRRQFSDTDVDVQYGHLVLTQVIDGINYIISHGDKQASKKIKDLVINYMRHDMMNIVAKGHLHQFSIGTNSLRYMDMVVPAIFSGNEYSEGLGYANAPGFVTCHNTKYGYPSVKFEPIEYVENNV